jgi:hypothetical protein
MDNMYKLYFFDLGEYILKFIFVRTTFTALYFWLDVK